MTADTLRPGSRRLRRIAISLGCVALGIIGGLVVFALTSVRRPPPPMNRTDFESAVSRWKMNRPPNYEMQIELSGRQSGTMHVVVKDNEPVSVQRNEARVTKTAWEYWTVEGLFEIIRSDLEALDQPERAFGATDVSQLVQQAEFESALGYPRRYRRAVLNTGDAIEWEITRFNDE